jgi:hypothetical protein
VDVANVMGARPDGWWRDRAGAAVRLHADLVRLAESGRPIEPGDAEAPGDTSPHRQAGTPDIVMVLEGAAKAAADRVPASAAGGRVRVVLAPRSGDDAIVALVRELPGRRAVVTADRELRARCVAGGATVLGPSWLLRLLRA